MLEMAMCSTHYRFQALSKWEMAHWQPAYIFSCREVCSNHHLGVRLLAVRLFGVKISLALGCHWNKSFSTLPWKQTAPGWEMAPLWWAYKCISWKNWILEIFLVLCFALVSNHAVQLWVFWRLLRNDIATHFFLENPLITSQEILEIMSGDGIWRKLMPKLACSPLSSISHNVSHF